MRQIITLHFGQAGIQIGSSFWELICSEHSINYEGNSTCQISQKNVDMGKAQVLFDETRKRKFVPRAFFLDSDPMPIDEIKTRQKGSLFHPDRFHLQKNGSCAYYTQGLYNFSSKREEIQNKFRKLIQTCNNIQAIIIFSSVCGGTGSGFVGGFLSILSMSYPKVPIISLLIYPSPRYSNLIVDSINAVLAHNQILQYSTANIIFDNQKIYDVCQNFLDVQNPNFTNLNQIISHVASSITAPQRFQGPSVTGINHVLTNLIPYRKLNCVTASYGPLTGQLNQNSDKFTVKNMTNFCFDRKNSLIKLQASQQNNLYSELCCSAFYRGDVNTGQIIQGIYQAKNKTGIKLVAWSPTGIQVNYTNSQPKPFANNFIKNSKVDCTVLMNTTMLRPFFSDIMRKYDSLYQKRAFMHWFASIYSNETITQARYNFQTMLKDYQEVVE